MTYADHQYIHVARKNELHHHDYEMSLLKLQLVRLTKSVEWEIKQHQSRIQELQQLENALSVKKSANKSKAHSTLQPLTNIENKAESQKEKSSSKRKIKRQMTQEPSAELVG